MIHSLALDKAQMVYAQWVASAQQTTFIFNTFKQLFLKILSYS
jgi:hypothetical protein